ncbi:hypothetical protein G6F37_002813 [Rhizopus arrhizus]|nr:hypothetical protein G6F37_002813 [Rhizopus arrhizus]
MHHFLSLKGCLYSSVDSTQAAADPLLSLISHLSELEPVMNEMKKCQVKVDSTKGPTYFARETEDGAIGKENMDTADAATGSGVWVKTVLEVCVDTELTRMELLRLSIDDLDGYQKVMTDEMNACSEVCDVHITPYKTRREEGGLGPTLFQLFIFLANPWFALCLDMSQKGSLIHGNLVWNQ